MAIRRKIESNRLNIPFSGKLQSEAMTCAGQENGCFPVLSSRWGLGEYGGVPSDAASSPDVAAQWFCGLFLAGASSVSAGVGGGLEVGDAAQSCSAHVSVEREKSLVDVKVGARRAAKFKAAEKVKQGNSFSSNCKRLLIACVVEQNFIGKFGYQVDSLRRAIYFIGYLKKSYNRCGVVLEFIARLAD
ncbi:hypothetical protein BDZ89DRAFT_1036371 [Hymenopellis radicata]|nr:hypothetical protein BDZ89DRAFT_1036371 [Hymenopellis radicata]